MSLFFFFDSFVASYSAISNFATLNFASLNLACFTLLGFNSLTLNNLVGFDLCSFNSVGSSLISFNLASSTFAGFNLVNSSFAGFYLAGPDFDIKLRFANAGFFSNSPSSHLASRFFLQGPGSLANVSCFNYPYPPGLLLSYFKHHYFSCQVCFADNLPNFRRNLPLSNLAMSAFSNTHLFHYTSPVHLPQAFSLPINQFDSNLFLLNNLHSTILQPYNLHPYVLESTTLYSPTLSSTLPQTISLQPTPLSSSNSQQGGIFFQFSLPKLRLSSFPFALYISRPSSLFPSPSDSHPLEPLDFNRSFYSQNLPSYVGLLGSFIHSSISDSTRPVGNSIDISTTFISNISSYNANLSTCELSSLHHFLNLRSRTASFFSFLDSFFLFDSPFLDSLPWDSFSLQQNPFCFPSLPSHLHTSNADFSLFDEELFLANCSFFPFGKRQSCLHKEHFSLQQDLFLPFNHHCSSYKEHFPLNQEHFLLGEEQFLANNRIFTSNISFPSTSFHQLQLCSTFLASSFQAATFKSNFNASFIPNLKTSFPAFLNPHLFFDNFACSANFPHFHNFFSFSHSTQLDIYYHLDKSCYCPSASLHFSQFNNSSLLSHYFSNLSNLVTQNHLTFNNYFCNSAYLAFQNHLTFSNFFCNLTFSKLHNNVFLSNYFSTLSSLVMHNNVFSNNYFCNLTFSKLHNNVFFNYYFSTLSSLVMYNNSFLSNFFCNFTYFTSLKSCSNAAILHNRSSYSSDLLAKYSVYSLHSPSFKTLLRNHTRSFYSSTLTKTSNNLSKKASSLRSHYRIKMSFEGKVPSHFAISLARNYLSKQFPNAILLASCHQNTNHTHIHVLLFARDVNGKKLHFSNSNYKKLDIGWAKIYSRVFGEHKFQQHIDKKAQSRSWKKDRMMGIDRQKPYRISVVNRHQQQLQPQFQQQFHQQQQQVQQQFQQHNQQQQQQFQQLNAHNNHYKHLQLTHNIDHKQLYNKLYNNHFGTNIELNQPYNQLYNKTFDLNIVQNHHLFNTFDNHFDKYLDFNSCRFYGLTLNDAVHFNKFDSIFVAKDLSFFAQDRAFDRPFDRISNSVFVDKLPSFDNKLPSIFDKHFDKTASIFDNSIDKHLSVADKNVTHFYNNPVPSALSMNNIAFVDKDLANHRPSTNLSHLHLNQQNLIHQLQQQQHNQQNLDLHPTHLNQHPLPQDLHQLQHNSLYNQTHLNQPINLTPLSSHTYLDLIRDFDNVYIDRFSDTLLHDRTDERVNDRGLDENALDETINNRVLLSRNDDDVLYKHSIATTDHILHPIQDNNLHPIQDNGLDRNHDYDYELDLDEPSR